MKYFDTACTEVYIPKKNWAQYKILGLDNIQDININLVVLIIKGQGYSDAIPILDTHHPVLIGELDLKTTVQ